MIASKDQTAAIMHGLEGQPNWIEVERPVGCQELPAWITGLHIDWCMQFANSPYVKFRATHFPMPEETLWQQGPKGRWFREYEGVIEQLWADGPLAQMENGDWETPKTQGHGGRTSTLKMVDGRTVHLRGSWFGGTPEGYNELTVVDMSSKYVKQDQQQGKVKWEFGNLVIHKNLKAKAWYKCGGYYGLYIPDDILIKAIAKYQPHVRIAKLIRERGDRIEPFLDEWNMPKGSWIRREWK
jgi:hypothetical protein